MKATTPFYILISIFFLSCDKHTGEEGTPVLFDSIPVSKQLVPLVNEISGIADSKVNPGLIWGHEDSGAPPALYLIGHDGHVNKTILVKDALNRDWEDMVLAGGQVYLGETGDNSLVYPEYLFYRFPEPELSIDTVTSMQTIRFTYPDGSHDAEAFLVDTGTMDILVITKSDNPSRIYKLTYPYGATNLVSLSGSLSYGGVVSAALSPDGSEVIVKTYGQLYHYKRKTGQNLVQVLQNGYTQVKHMVEPQGEAISFAANNSGFYTLSEKGFASFVNLNFYPRK